MLVVDTKERHKERERERAVQSVCSCSWFVWWSVEELNAAYADHVFHRSWSFVGD
jgi:hypothetical protein